MIEKKLGFFFLNFLISLLLKNTIFFLVLAGKSSYLTVTYWKIAIVQLVTWPRVIWWNQNPGVFALGLPANTQHLDFPDFH